MVTDIDRRLVSQKIRHGFRGWIRRDLITLASGDANSFGVLVIQARRDVKYQRNRSDLIVREDLLRRFVIESDKENFMSTPT